MDAIFYILSGAGAGALAAVLFLSIRHGRHRERFDSENAVLVQALREARELGIRHDAEKQALERQIAQHHEDLEKLQARFGDQFENLAHKIFEKKSETFKVQSQEGLNRLLDPLKEKLGEFQKKVDQSFGDQAKEQFSLKEQIKNIVEVNQKMNLQAESLAKALKGDSKVQGDWGEIILERILEDAGLQKGRDYEVQGAGLKLKDIETGGAQKPDVILFLPESKHIVIDSKTSLTHYERFCSEEDESLRPGHAAQFLASVRDHVKELERRRYQDSDKLNASDIVLMFMPIEGAYSMAMQQDRALHQFAWDKRIVIVCPSTLFATVRTIASVRRLERQNQYAQEIARQGGALYDKIAGFMKDMQILGNQIKTVEKTYEASMNKLSEGKDNILRKAEKLKELGAKTSKSLPKTILGLESDAAADNQDGALIDLEEKKRA